MVDDEMKRSITRSIFRYMVKRSGPVIYAEMQATLPYEIDDLLDVLAMLEKAKFIEWRGPLAFWPGINYEDWENLMIHKGVPVQNFNIGHINGPANIGGQGDINITINKGDAEALVALIRELSKPKPQKDTLDKVNGILNAGKTGLEILKDLAIAGSVFLL